MKPSTERLEELAASGKALVKAGVDAMLDGISSRGLGELAEELLQYRLDKKTISGLRHLRRLALGEDETINPDLPDSVLAELAEALRWLDVIMRLPVSGAETPTIVHEPYCNSPKGMADAHADGMHADSPREGCPECSVQFRRQT